MSDRLRVAHHFAPATSALLSSHPLVGEVRAIDTNARWNLPTDVDVIFAPPDFSDISANAPRPDGWPGSVRFVQIASSGIDGYPAWMFEGPQVATSAGTGAPPIAEFVVTTMLMHEKRMPAMVVGAGDPWPAQADMLANPLGSLDGKTLGLLGVGQIAIRVARLAAAFGMTVVAHRRSDAPSPAPEITLVPFDELLARADHLVLAAPLSADTAGLLGTAAFGRIKPGVHLVNIARGGLIDTAALIAALESGRVSAASLDVTDPEPLPADHPLWRAPNVQITPHISWSSAGTPRRIFALFADNLTRLAQGQPLINAIRR